MKKETNMTNKTTGLIKRMALTGQLTRLTVYIVTIIPSIFFIVLAILQFAGVFQPVEFNSPMVANPVDFGTGSDFLVFALLICTGIFGTYSALHVRRVRKIDSRFPDFVRDLAESRRAGMTFTKAIMYSSKGNYGVLTSEIQKIARQISWGSSVDNALNAFSKRVNTKLIRRTISLIIEASRSGGNVADVLDAASKDAREIKLIDAERRASMMSYVAVIYVGMGVFLLIIVVLSSSFLPNMINEQVAGEAASSGVALGGGDLTQAAISAVFFTACIIQSAGMGLVTGVFEEGNVISGVKHSFIMMLVTFVVFKFVIGGI